MKYSCVGKYDEENGICRGCELKEKCKICKMPDAQVEQLLAKAEAWDNLENIFHIYVETTPDNTHYLTVAEKDENHVAYTSVEGCATECIINEEYETLQKAGLE